jgi:hypothetical protein
MSSLPLRGLVPIARVTDLARSIAFYRQLGFEVRSTLEPDGQLIWAWLNNGRSHLMLSRAEHAMPPGTRDVILYLYAPNVVGYRDQLAANGVKVGPIEYPPYMPEGEFGLEDPDGYCLLVGQTDEVSL